MDSLKKSLANKYICKPTLDDAISKKLILILFKNEIEIHICKVLFLCSNDTVGVRCHKTSFEFMLNLKTGKIMSYSFDTKYLILFPNLDKSDKIMSISQTYHISCEILVKDILEFISLYDSTILVNQFHFIYI